MEKRAEEYDAKERQGKWRRGGERKEHYGEEWE